MYNSFDQFPNINFLSPRGCYVRPLASSCLIFSRPIFLQLQLKHRQPKLTTVCEMGRDPSMKAVLGYTAAVLKIGALYKTLYGEKIT